MTYLQSSTHALCASLNMQALPMQCSVTLASGETFAFEVASKPTAWKAWVRGHCPADTDFEGATYGADWIGR